MDFRLKIAQDGVIHAKKQLEEWLRAIQKHPGLELLWPQNERILRLNLEAAKERVDRLASEKSK